MSARARGKRTSRINALFVIAAVVIGLILILLQNDSPDSGEVLGIDSGKPGSHEGGISAHFIDVGQGDAELVVLYDGRTVLIDGGETEYAEKVVSYIKDLGIEDIDYYIMSHPHSDHIGASAAIIEAFDIGEIYMPKTSKKDTPTTRVYERTLDALIKKGHTLRQAFAGEAIISEEGLSVVFVAPNGEDYENLNDYSAGVRLTYGKVSFLFCGDAEDKSEEEMLGSGLYLSADVYKASHHGSRTSNTADFLSAVNPKIIIITCGEGNSYGHPHEDVLKRFEDTGADIYRTDIHGSIIITTDGKTISPVTTEKAA